MPHIESPSTLHPFLSTASLLMLSTRTLTLTKEVSICTGLHCACNGCLLWRHEKYTLEQNIWCIACAGQKINWTHVILFKAFMFNLLSPVLPVCAKMLLYFLSMSQYDCIYVRLINNHPLRISEANKTQIKTSVRPSVRPSVLTFTS